MPPPTQATSSSILWKLGSTANLRCFLTPWTRALMLGPATWLHTHVPKHRVHHPFKQEKLFLREKWQHGSDIHSFYSGSKPLYIFIHIQVFLHPSNFQPILITVCYNWSKKYCFGLKGKENISGYNWCPKQRKLFQKLFFLLKADTQIFTLGLQFASCYWTQSQESGQVL